MTEKATKMNVWQMPESSKYLRENLVSENGHLFYHVLKRSGGILQRRVPQGAWGHIADEMLLEFAESGCPTFRAITPLSRSKLKSKGHRKLSIHFAADQETIENIFRIIVFANQLSLNGAAANMCEEFESFHDRSGQFDVVMGQSSSSLVLREIKTEVPLDNDDLAYQNFLLQRYEERIESLSQTDRVSKFCMDAGFIHVVETGQYFMTKDIGEQFFARACREYTLPRSDETSQPKGWIQGNTKIEPVLEVTTSCLYGKHGIEIRIWSLIQDNSQSWVRISHGSNKFVIDSNYNNTEVPADLLEEQASQLKMKDFAARSKAEAKPQRREPVDLPSIIPMNERKWIDIEPGESSLSAYEVSKKSNQSSSTLSNSTTRRRRSSSILEDQESSSESISTNIGRMSVGKHAWQQEEEQKGDISTALIFQEQYSSPSSSRTFRTQSC